MQSPRKLTPDTAVPLTVLTSIAAVSDWTGASTGWNTGTLASVEAMAVAC